MVPCEAASTPSAPYSASVTHCEVSTFPATTAAGYRGRSMQASGMRTSSGFRQPALSGMSSPTSVRKTYRTAAIETAEGALKLRSEEHTSELQSRRDLVCRLLLEKKKKE